MESGNNTENKKICYYYADRVSCGMGNQLLNYLNLVQMTNIHRNLYDEEVSYYSLESTISFSFLFRSDLPSHSLDVTNSSLDSFRIVPFKHSLAERFHLPGTEEPNTVFPELNRKIWQNRNRDKKSLAIHFRGKDFNTWRDGKGILGFEEYYKPALHDIIDEYGIFYLYTDDPKHPAFNKTFYYLRDDLELNVEIVDTGIDHYKAFVHMAQTDGILSCPSTFSIMSAVCSKNPDMKIYHSKRWVDWRLSENDTFWVELVRGERHTDSYRITKLY